MSVNEKLLSTTDAMVWAEEFCRAHNGKKITCGPWEDGLVGEGTMVGWFANAIEVAREAGRTGRR